MSRFRPMPKTPAEMRRDARTSDVTGYQKAMAFVGALTDIKCQIAPNVVDLLLEDHINNAINALNKASGANINALSTDIDHLLQGILVYHHSLPGKKTRVVITRDDISRGSARTVGSMHATVGFLPCGPGMVAVAGISGPPPTVHVPPTVRVTPAVHVTGSIPSAPGSIPSAPGSIPTGLGSIRLSPITYHAPVDVTPSGTYFLKKDMTWERCDHAQIYHVCPCNEDGTPGPCTGSMPDYSVRVRVVSSTTSVEDDRGNWIVI